MIRCDGNIHPSVILADAKDWPATWGNPGRSQARSLKESFGDFRTGRHDEGLFADAPDGRSTVDAPNRESSLLGDYLRRDEVQIFTGSEVGINMLAAEKRQHHVSTSTTDSRSGGYDAARVDACGAGALFIIHLAAEGHTGHISTQRAREGRSAAVDDTTRLGKREAFARELAALYEGSAAADGKNQASDATRGFREWEEDFGLKNNADQWDAVFHVVGHYGISGSAGGEVVGAVERICTGDVNAGGACDARLFEMKRDGRIDVWEARLEDGENRGIGFSICLSDEFFRVFVLGFDGAGETRGDDFASACEYGRDEDVCNLREVGHAFYASADCVRIEAVEASSCCCQPPSVEPKDLNRSLSSSAVF